MITRHFKYGGGTPLKLAGEDACATSIKRLATKVGFQPSWRVFRTEYNGFMNTREITETVQDWQKRATETAKNLGEATDTYVRENPWTTLALAAVIGCIFGYLLANRD